MFDYEDQKFLEELFTEKDTDDSFVKDGNKSGEKRDSEEEQLSIREIGDDVVNFESQFLSPEHGIEKLDDELRDRGFKVGAIHGNKRQSQRQRILESFKRSEIQVLLATDVASRGLDIPNVTHVINYELPETYEDYIHRIGRTGRANQKGIALTFITGSF